MPDATPPDAKPFWQSKTVWLNALVLLCTFVPAAAAWVKANPVDAMEALGALNILVRFATSGKVTIFRGDDSPSNGSSSGLGTGGGMGAGNGMGPGASNSKLRRTLDLPWLVVSACVAVLLFLSGCNQAQLDAFKQTPITIGIDGQHGSYGYSSKGGLVIEMKVPTVRQEKSTIDIEAVIEREHAAGRFAPAIFDPRRPYQPRRMALLP